LPFVDFDLSTYFSVFLGAIQSLEFFGEPVLNTTVTMGYSTQLQSRFANKVGEPVPEFNSE
jgi:hypothetical protein